MARRKKHPEHENHERWLVSYADFITLLFAFFVVMFASSQADKSKAQAVSNSVREAFDAGAITALVTSVLGGTVGETGPGNAQRNGPGGAQIARYTGEKPGLSEGYGGRLVELQPALEHLSEALRDEIASGQMQLSLEPRGLVVSFREAAFFSSGEAAVSEAHIDSIGKVAKVLRELPNPVRMEGHTDSVPIHNSRFESNWELSAARSIAMLELFANRFEIPREKLSIAAYADNAPVAPNETENGRSRNRRVDIILLSKIGVQAEPPGAESGDGHGDSAGPRSEGGHEPSAPEPKPAKGHH